MCIINMCTINRDDDSGGVHEEDVLEDGDIE